MWKKIWTANTEKCFQVWNLFCRRNNCIEKIETGSITEQQKMMCFGTLFKKVFFGFFFQIFSSAHFILFITCYFNQFPFHRVLLADCLSLHLSLSLFPPSHLFNHNFFPLSTPKWGFWYENWRWRRKTCNERWGRERQEHWRTGSNKAISWRWRRRKWDDPGLNLGSLSLPPTFRYLIT